MKDKADVLIEVLKLKAHPEGGYYREYYRSDEITGKNCLPGRFNTDHCLSTSIYFMLKKGDISKFHRIKSDEIWHLYDGGPLELITIEKKGDLRKQVLGRDIENGESYYAVIPAGRWMAARNLRGDEYTLAGCTTAPGFEFGDFELAGQAILTHEYPQHEKLINELT